MHGTIPNPISNTITGATTQRSSTSSRASEHGSTRARSASAPSADMLSASAPSFRIALEPEGAVLASLAVVTGKIVVPAGTHLLVARTTGDRSVCTFCVRPARSVDRVVVIAPGSGIIVRFDDRYVLRLLGRAGLDALAKGERTDLFDPDMGPLTRLGLEWLEGRSAVPTVLDAHAAMLVSCALRCLDRAPVYATHDERVARAVAFIDERLAERLTVASVASAVGVSTFHFARVFHDRTGLPPHAFIVRRRIERACELLRSTDEPLASIAYLCGFSHQSHMTSLFTQTLHRTPGAIRKEARGERMAA